MGDPRLAILNKNPISSWSYPRILVGIPLERALSYADKVFWPFMKIASQGPAFVSVPYGRIDFVRNRMAIELLTGTFSHLLMLDVDHIHPADIVKQFAKTVITDPDIRVLSGLNFRRGTPFDPVFGIHNKDGQRVIAAEWEQGLISVDEVGGGSLMVHRSVFEEMEPPWFFNDYTKVWANEWPGEDIGFSQKCKALGIPMYVDTSITSPHCTDSVVTEETFRRYMEKHAKEFTDV